MRLTTDGLSNMMFAFKPGMSVNGDTFLNTSCRNIEAIDKLGHEMSL